MNEVMVLFRKITPERPPKHGEWLMINNSFRPNLSGFQLSDCHAYDRIELPAPGKHSNLQGDKLNVDGYCFLDDIITVYTDRGEWSLETFTAWKQRKPKVTTKIKLPCFVHRSLRGNVTYCETEIEASRLGNGKIFDLSKEVEVEIEVSDE